MDIVGGVLGTALVLFGIADGNPWEMALGAILVALTAGIAVWREE